MAKAPTIAQLETLQRDLLATAGSSDFVEIRKAAELALCAVDALLPKLREYDRLTR